jgi:hypothetical protein
VGHYVGLSKGLVLSKKEEACDFEFVSEILMVFFLQIFLINFCLRVLCNLYMLEK